MNKNENRGRTRRTDLKFKESDIAPVTVRNHKLSWRCKGNQHNVIIS